MSTSQRIELDPHQFEAASASIAASLNVVAGAGTGKTRVLVERYLTFVERDGVPLDRVLALTFTLKAAGEMRERVRRELARRAPRLAQTFPSAWIMNFHQFGYRFIKENAPALGIDPGIDVVSPAEFERVQSLLRARFESGRIVGVPADFGGEPPIPTKLGRLFDLLLDVVHHCRGNMIDVAKLRARVRDDDHAPYRAHVDTVVALAAEYEAELRRRNLLDFSDMIAIPARALLDGGPIAERYRGMFAHILVDEFQDTSRAQNEMLRALAGGEFERVTVVGDVKQSIYRWRDARVENILEFPAPRTRLTRNYRSARSILDLAHALVAATPELAEFAAPLEAHRDVPSYAVLLFHPRETTSDYAQEARAVAAWVEHLLGRAQAPAEWGLEAPAKPLDPGDVCVLLRRMKLWSYTRRTLEEEFAARGIPYAIVGGANRAEARALDMWHAMMSLLVPGDRAIALLAVLENEPFRVSDASLHELLSKRGGAINAWDLLAEERVARVSDSRDAGAMRDLRALLIEIEAASARLDFRVFMVWAFDRSSLRMHLVDEGVSNEAIDELLCDLLELADLLVRRGGGTLAVFLEHLRAALDEGKFREDGDVRLPRDRVVIMTVHQAKGLEFPAVAVPGVEPFRPPSEGFLVSRNSGVYFSKDRAEKWRREMTRAENYAEEEAMKALEERCILYVAMTRAKDYLWVSSPVADGTIIQKRAANKTSLFTDLLECARRDGLATELREAPAPVTMPAASVARSRAKPDALDDAVAQWAQARAAIDNATAAAAGARLESVTWSGLASFARCPLQFAFDRAGVGESEDAAPRRDAETTAALPKGIEAADFGAFVHAALEALAARPSASIDDVLQSILARFDFGKKGAEALRAARARIEPVVTSHPFTTATRAEVPFAVRVGSVMVQGVIDRLDETDDGAVVIDYKVGERADEHAFQARVYTWAVGRARGQSKATGRLAYLREGATTLVEVASAQTSVEIERLVRAIDAAVHDGNFVPTPGEVCAACPHRSVCEHAV